MCAQFVIRSRAAVLSRKLRISRKKIEDDYWRDRILPHALAPVLVADAEGRDLRAMNFSLIPAWSKDRKPKFATHNARLMSEDSKTGKVVPIYEKPTWRAAFSKRHCIIPMEAFIESLYTGKHAGNMVAFARKDEELLLAAGIWETWEDKKSGEVVDSFAILTDDPVPDVAKNGHDRSPVFLSEEAAEAWLNPDGVDPARWLKELRAGREKLALVTEIDRPLAKGWEKRAPK